MSNNPDLNRLREQIGLRSAAQDHRGSSVPPMPRPPSSASSSFTLPSKIWIFVLLAVGTFYFFDGSNKKTAPKNTEVQTKTETNTIPTVVNTNNRQITSQESSAANTKSVQAPYQFHFSSDSDMPGADINTTPYSTSSFVECGNLCLENPSCVAFVYNTKASACFLKSIKGWTSKFNGAEVGYIANRSSFNNYTPQRIISEVNSDYPWGDFKEVRTVSRDYCETYCANEVWCRGYAFIESKKLCFLKNKILSQRILKNGVQSGIK